MWGGEFLGGGMKSTGIQFHQSNDAGLRGLNGMRVYQYSQFDFRVGFGVQ